MRADQERREQRLARYDELRAERPGLFANPPGAAFEIVFDRASQLAAAETAAEQLRAEGRPAEYGDMGVVYEDRFAILVRDTVRFRDGKIGPYIRLLGADSGTGAAILPMLNDGQILLVRHFRHGLRGWQWEIPRGFSEGGADGATTAARELAEEIGVATAKIEPLGRLAAEGAFDEIYLARLAADTLPVMLPAEAVTEGIDERRLCTSAELAAMIAAGEITDQYLLAAWAFATAKGHI
ncbi:ADP-ribose pyrophosphatase [Micromonospora kangleipakensis]|uniref:ADP-ribose pyrophosphatase n=1 Tax=Micromonospora kangleipakensis TaxID=1077942 RepID=A0A4Q8BFQ9_9ACTN|nr:NUDIX hydrolase [Micromonospora kangleipakensis]RZU76019.1 ADP-ribose pyrophosphatase [Micromonospora kangleipakensis]